MDKIRKFAVIGHPIGHTMSPFIHKKLFAFSGITAEYTTLDVTDIAASENVFSELDGFNITIPHKRNIIPFLDSLDRKAQIFGSVNTVLSKDGELIGYTTDGVGCLEALKNHNCYPVGKILILGSGGAARAIASEICLSVDIPDITLCVRLESIEKSMELIDTLKEINPKGTYSLLSFEAEEKNSVEYNLLINATPVGMYPNTGVSPVSENVVNRCINVFDSIYNPGETELIRIAKSLNKNIIPGIEMLVFQAVVAHKHWYGAEFRREDLLKLCDDAAEETAKIFND